MCICPDILTYMQMYANVAATKWGAFKIKYGVYINNPFDILAYLMPSAFFALISPSLAKYCVTKAAKSNGLFMN